MTTTQPNPAASSPLVATSFDPIRAALLVMIHEAQKFNATVMREAGIGPFDLVAIRQAEAALATPVHQAAEPLCACKDRPASQCDEEWGPNCDLGNNAAHVHVSQTDPKLIDAALKAAEPAPSERTSVKEALEWIAAAYRHDASPAEKSANLFHAHVLAMECLAVIAASPAPMSQAAVDSDMVLDARKAALNDAVKACEGEYLHEPQAGTEDRAYDMGVRDCANAIRAIVTNEREDAAPVTPQAVPVAKGGETVWTLTAPDGLMFTAESPLRCARAASTHHLCKRCGLYNCVCKLARSSCEALRQKLLSRS